MIRKSCCPQCAALGHVVEVLEALAKRECCGHEGDEETGEHYEDCMRCRVDAALAHAEEVAATRYVAPQNHHSFALESLKRDNQLLAADYDGALARAQKNAQLLAGIVDWIDEHPEDPVPPSVLLIEAREAAEYAGMGRVRCAECGGIDVAPKRPGCSGVLHRGMGEKSPWGYRRRPPIPPLTPREALLATGAKWATSAAGLAVPSASNDRSEINFVQRGQWEDEAAKEAVG